MKLKAGPIEFSFKEAPKPSAPTSELGSTGTSFFSGILTGEEYNTDLQGSKGRDIYEKMRKSDAQVKATLLACELPLRAAIWRMEPASDDPGDVEIAEFVENNLMEGMTITFDSFLKHVLLMLPFGYSIFERVYALEDGRIKWRKLAPRLPKTLYKWNINKQDGGLDGIEQFVFKNDKYEFVDIPADRLVIFTNDKEGSNFEGTSLLRAAYKHWYYKSNLERIDAIAAERHALGVPTLEIPDTATTEDIAKADKILQRLHAHEKSYMRHKAGWSFDIKGLSGSIKEIMPSIEYHDRMIGHSILASFLTLGSRDVGSYALSRDQSSFFLMALNAIGKNVCDTMNRYAIQPLVDYNWNVESYPKLAYSPLETRDIESYCNAISGLIEKGALTTGTDVENTLRDLLKLPPKPEPEEGEPPPEEITPGDEDTGEHTGFHAEPKAKRELTYAETFVAFTDIKKALDSAQAAFVKAAKDTMERQINNLADTAFKIIEGRQLDKIDDIEVRYKTQMAEDFVKILKEIYEYGRGQVKKELQSQTHTSLDELPLDPADEELIMHYIMTRAKASANTLALKLKQFTTFEALRQVKAGVMSKDELLTGLRGLSDKELVASAQYSVSESFGLGRGVEAEKNGAGIERSQYSAILDENTCDHCAKLDGEEWNYDDPRTAKYASGNPECLGASKCRCLLVYISKVEVKGKFSDATIRRH